MSEPYISKHHLNVTVKPSLYHEDSHKVTSEVEIEVHGKATTFIDSECYKFSSSSGPMLGIKRDADSTRLSKENKIAIKIGKFDRKGNKKDEFVEFEIRYLKFNVFESINANDYLDQLIRAGIDLTTPDNFDAVSHYITQKTDPESLELIYSVLDPQIDIMSGEKWEKSIRSIDLNTILKSNQFLKHWNELILGTLLPKYQVLNLKDFFKNVKVCVVGNSELHNKLIQVLRDNHKTAIVESVTDVNNKDNQSTVLQLYKSKFIILSLGSSADMQNGLEEFVKKHNVKYLDNESFLKGIVRNDKSIWVSFYNEDEHHEPTNTTQTEVNIKTEPKETSTESQGTSYRSKFAKRKKAQVVDPFDMLYGMDEEGESSNVVSAEPEKQTSALEPQQADSLQDSLDNDSIKPTTVLSSRRQRFKQLQNSSSKNEDFLLFGDDEDVETVLDKTHKQINNTEPKEAGQDEDIEMKEPEPIGESNSPVEPPVPTKVIKGTEFTKLQSILEARRLKEEADSKATKHVSYAKSEPKDVKLRVGLNNTAVDNSKLIEILQKAKQAKTEENDQDYENLLDDENLNKEIREKIQIVSVEIKPRTNNAIANNSYRSSNGSDKWAGLKNFKKFVPRGRKVSNSTGTTRRTENVVLIKHQEGLTNDSNMLTNNKDIQYLDNQILHSQQDNSEFSQFDSEFNDLRITRKRQNMSTLVGGTNVNSKKTKQAANDDGDGLFVADSDDSDDDNVKEVNNALPLIDNSENTATAARRKRSKLTDFEPEFTRAVDQDFEEEDEEDLGIPKFRSSRSRKR